MRTEDSGTRTRREMKPRLLFLLLSWFAAAELKPRKGPAAVCTFKEKRFNPGDSWHPDLEPFGFMFCIRCLCSETGHVKCSTVKCPALSCPHPVAPPRHCCPRCTDDPRVPAGLRASLRSCRFNGTLYQPGDTFTKLDLFPTRNNDQCVMCTCSDGNVFCGLKTCPPVTCSSPVSLPDSCCPLCQDHGSSSSAEEANQQLNRGVRHSVDRCSGELSRAPSDRTAAAAAAAAAAAPRLRTSPRGLSLSKLNLRGASETTVKILLQRKHQRACLYNGVTYSHGDSWHPVLGKVLECIVCTCTDGLQDCKRITCPARYPCQRPLKAPGKCCKTCPDSLQSEVNQTRCSLGFRNLLSVYKVASWSLRVDSPDSVRVIAVERGASGELELQVWNTVEGVLQLMEMGDVEKKELKDHPGNYTLLTTLDEDMWGEFKEAGGNLSSAPATVICASGIREVVTFLNPKQTEGRCSP